MDKLEIAHTEIEGRYDVLHELRREISNTTAIERDANYARMKDSWYKYFALSKELAA